MAMAFPDPWRLEHEVNVCDIFLSENKTQNIPNLSSVSEGRVIWPLPHFGTPQTRSWTFKEKRLKINIM